MTPHAAPVSIFLAHEYQTIVGGGNNRVDGKFLEMVVGIKGVKKW